MKIDVSRFRVKAGTKVKLKDLATKTKGICASEDEYKEVLEDHVKQLAKLHDLLYGANKYAVLLVLQGMDTAGKDGVVKHVMSGVNPTGCEVTSFKQPSAEELEHDFLWRSYAKLPRRGTIGIFNRSYYEEVLVVRVHPELLANEALAARANKDSGFWEERYESIVTMERHLYRNHTRIVKVFLHLSKEEQRKRFLSRIDVPEKNWKFNMGDIRERKYWKQYQDAYQDCVRATSTDHAPWYVVPADDKENARLIVSQILVDTLGGLKMEYPRVTNERRKELQQIRGALEGNTAENAKA
ncbi:MAG TPA: ADP-polyphosphate phosphotransferase [Acidobacteriaceae bacterium]|nr:ADP-polyphosphate phosphotransferase [Acidobacteriaceae bacterium]